MPSLHAGRPFAAFATFLVGSPKEFGHPGIAPGMGAGDLRPPSRTPEYPFGAPRRLVP